jgi:predicted Zn-dependent protease
MDLQNITQEEFERIEAYITGQLSDEKHLEFEKQLKDDNEFKTKVDDVKTILLGIETQSLKEQLNDFHEDLTKDSDKTIISDPKVKSIGWQKLAIAAALIIAAGSFWFLGGNSNDRLYSKYFSPDPGLPTTMSSNDNYEFNKAMVDYKQGKYDDALSIWKTQLETKTENDTLNYFIASALLADNNEKEAIDYFLKVTKHKEDRFKPEAYHYLGLAYLKMNDKVSAINALKKSNLATSKNLLEKLN